MKKALVPKRVSLCTECPHVIGAVFTTYGVDTNGYLCTIGHVGFHEFPTIPEGCPLEDWIE